MVNNVIPAKAGIHNEFVDPGVRRGDVNLPAAAAAPMSRAWTEDEAFAYCAGVTSGHYENFPVGSVLIPKALRPAVQSLYAFMRTADDFSDENRRPGDEEERLGYIKTWDAMLTDCENGKASHPIFIALRRTLKTHALPAQWLHDLLHAFAMDCTIRRYATYDDLLAYCRYSANPVGRLILTLFGYRDDELYRLSDAICTGLQLANHWQDVAVDFDKDRIYLPQDDMTRFGVTEDMLAQKAAGAPFQKLLAFEVARAWDLFAAGRTLPERVHGRLRYELRFTWRGGARILDKIESAQYDVFRRRPVVTKADWFGIAVRSIL